MKTQQLKRSKIVVSFRSVLLASIALSIMVLFTVVIALFYTQNKGIAQTTVQQHVMVTSSEVIRETKEYLSNAEHRLMSLNVLLVNNIANTNNVDRLLTILTLLLSTDDHINALYLADDKGYFYMAKRMPGGSISNRIVYRSNDKIISQWFHQDTELQYQFSKYSEESLGEGYDPRKRPWYRIAQSGIVTWGDPYIFYTDKQIGITAVRQVSNKYFKGVLAVDIGLSYLTNFVKRLQFSTSGDVLITDENHNVIAYSGQLDAISQDKTITEIRNVDTQRMSPALKYKLQNQNQRKNDFVRSKNIIKILVNFFSLDQYINVFETTKIEERTIIDMFSYDRDNYIYSNIDFSSFSGIKWNVHILTNELSVVGNIYNTIKISIGILVCMFIIIMLVFSGLSKVITRPIVQLSDLMQHMKNLSVEHQYKSTKRLEFAELSSMGNVYNSVQKSLVSFKKFVPQLVIQRAIDQNVEIVPQMEIQNNITILFSDIIGFTAIAETCSPQNLSEALNMYFTELSRIIYKYNGMIDKFIGDSIMALFGIFIKNDNHAENACKGALIMQLAHEKINKIISEKNGIVFQTKIGINSAQAIVGIIGSDTKLNFTAIGDSVNLASRLESLNKTYNSKIIISERTKNQISDKFITKYLDRVQVKGQMQYTNIYLLSGYKN